MKAIVEIKLNENIEVSMVDYKTYENVIDQILEDGGYQLIDVVPYDGNPDNHRDFTESKLNEVTFVSLLIDLEENQIKDFEIHELDIMEKVLDILGQKYLDLI